MTSFSQLLNAYINRHGINITDLAKKTQIRRETLARWISGEVSRPRQREDILCCAEQLDLDPQECNQFLIAAGFLESSLPPPLDLPISLVSFNHSPFVVGPPITEPRQFFGREYLLKRIFNIWGSIPLQHIAIVGLKRSGKTSLLHYLRRIIDTPKEQLRHGQRNNWLTPGYQWVFVDFQDPRMCYQEGLLRHLLIELDMPVPDPCDLINFMEITDQYLEIPTLILLDEISVGLESPELDEQFWWGLRSLGSNHAGGNIGFLLTAQESPEQLMLDDNRPSPFFNIFGHVLNLGPLTEPEALALIVNSPRPFSEQDIAWILEQSGRWPALIQILCHTCLLALEEETPREIWQKEALKRMNPYRYLLEQ
jgi:hypothetical protein